MVRPLQFSIAFECFMLWLPLEWNENTQFKTQLFVFNAIYIFIEKKIP